MSMKLLEIFSQSKWKVLWTIQSVASGHLFGLTQEMDQKSIWEHDVCVVIKSEKSLLLSDIGFVEWDPVPGEMYWEMPVL